MIYRVAPDYSGKLRHLMARIGRLPRGVFLPCGPPPSNPSSRVVCETRPYPGELIRCTCGQNLWDQRTDMDETTVIDDYTFGIFCDPSLCRHPKCGDSSTHAIHVLWAMGTQISVYVCTKHIMATLCALVDWAAQTEIEKLTILPQTL